jgi:hypothetical protein
MVVNDLLDTNDLHGAVLEDHDQAHCSSQLDGVLPFSASLQRVEPQGRQQAQILDRAALAQDVDALNVFSRDLLPPFPDSDSLFLVAALQALRPKSNLHRDLRPSLVSIQPRGE